MIRWQKKKEVVKKQLQISNHKHSARSKESCPRKKNLIILIFDLSHACFSPPYSMSLFVETVRDLDELTVVSLGGSSATGRRQVLDRMVIPRADWCRIRNQVRL